MTPAELPPLATEATRSLVASLGEIVAPARPIALAAPRDVSLALGAIALAALSAATLTLRPRRRVVALGVVTFVAFVLPPTLTGGSLVLGQRLYLPAAGVAILVAELLRAAALERGALIAGASVVLVVLALVTFAFEGTFRDRRAFAREAVDASPHCGLAHLCLAQSLQIAGDDDDRALAEYHAALDLGAAQVAHNNIAVILMKRARWADAQSELAQEIAVNPSYARAHLNMAIVLRHEGRSAEACASVMRASEMRADDAAIEAERARDCGEPP